jgi:hypothetical protein
MVVSSFFLFGGFRTALSSDLSAGQSFRLRILSRQVERAASSHHRKLSDALSSDYRKYKKTQRLVQQKLISI